MDASAMSLQVLTSNNEMPRRLQVRHIHFVLIVRRRLQSRLVHHAFDVSA